MDEARAPYNNYSCSYLVEQAKKPAGFFRRAFLATVGTFAGRSGDLFQFSDQAFQKIIALLPKILGCNIDPRQAGRIRW